jgi:hypothetical protein
LRRVGRESGQESGQVQSINAEGEAVVVPVTEPPKLLGPPTIVLVQRSLDNPIDAHNYSTSSVSVSLFPRPRALHPSCIYYNTSEEQISESELK